MIQTLITEELTEEGYDVFSAVAGSHVVDLIRGQRPDLVVLDYNPRGSDSKGLMHNLKKSFPELPIVLWTTYPFMIKSIKFIGADHYVYKSSDFTPLKLEIKLALEGVQSYQKPYAPYGEDRASSAEFDFSEAKEI